MEALMTRFALAPLLIMLILFGSGCAIRIGGTPAYYVADIREVDFSQDLTRGETCTHQLFFVVFDRASIVEAARNAGITKISLVDNYYSSVLGLWSAYCVVVIDTRAR
jgi:hypothetical protein